MAKSAPAIVTVLLLLGTLLFSPNAVPAADPDASPDGASASPSDAPPAPPEATADEAKASCCATCRPRRIKCRKLLGRLRCVRRSRCVPCCEPAEAAPEKPDPYAWKDLFDGKTLEGWKTPEFGGEGEVRVEDGAVILEMGSTMTAITYTGEVPRDNYELAWEGVRLDGIDFFATATFPVGKDECSFVTGGWGGMVAGISCIDYYDASDNLTTTFQEFKDKQWYKFRARVTPAKIEVWIDDQQVVNVEREGKKIGIRDEVDLCRPLGFSSWVTTGGVKNIRIRKLKPADGG